ncbi:MAG: hypothetical protein ACI9AU_001027 [Bacteroidia bacterium]|jgi:hypothetical protein
MSNIRYIVAILTCILLIDAYAQDPERKHSIGVYQNFTDYNVSILNDEIFAFDSALSQSFRVAYVRRLSRTWMLNTGINNGFILNQNLKETFIPKAYAIGADIGVQFKLNNGRLMKENSFIAPFLSFGYKTDYISKLKEFDKSPWLFHNQYGAGFNLRMGKRTHMQTQVTMGQKLGGDFNTHLEYRIGLTQSLGKAKQEVLPKNPNLDSDQDGLVDSKDDCPGLFGNASNNGCPDTTAYFAKKVGYDSLEELALNQQNRISEIELQNAKLRIRGDSDTSREQELLLRIFNLEKENKRLASSDPVKVITKTIVRVDTVYKTDIVYTAKGDDSAANDVELLKLRKEKEALEARLIADQKRSKEQQIARLEKLKLEMASKDTSDNVLAGKIVTPVPTIPVDKNYYIITISSPNISTAEAWLNKMRKDFSEARILPQPNGYYRVGVYAAKDKKLGLEILEKVKELGYVPAWLSLE